MKLNPVKQAIIELLARNAYFNQKAYKALSAGETARLLALVEECAQMDCIEDPYEIVRLREQVAAGLSWTTKDENVMNCLCYGIWKALFPFSSLGQAIYTPSVEHGFFPADIVANDLLKTARMAAVSFGPYRKECIRKRLEIPVFQVGPYVQYAEPFYDAEKIKAQKKVNGRTLLVFLGHSVNTFEIERSYQKLIEEIRKASVGFDTVLVSLFWWDARAGLVDALMSAGFRVVSAGYVCDPYFLSRSRTMIELADCAISDAVGTHAAYCAALDCPFSLTDLGPSPVGYPAFESDEIAQHERVNKSLSEAIHGGVSADVAKGRYGYYWGLGIKRSVQDRKDIARISGDLLALTNGSVGRIPEATRQLIGQYRRNNEFGVAQLLEEAL